MKLSSISIAVLATVLCINSGAAVAASCQKQGSSVSIATIQKKYKNCVNCGTQRDSKGKTVYYCYCGTGCSVKAQASSSSSKVATTVKNNSSSANKTSSTSSSVKTSGSCKKQGSSVSIATIQKKYSNCVNCGTQKDSKGKTVYYCYCGNGCSETAKASSSGSSKLSSVASAAVSSSSSSKSSGTCQKQGSHESINYIKKHYKNCSDCYTENVAAGKCSKNKKAHKHYYCSCGDGCEIAKATKEKKDSLSNKVLQGAVVGGAVGAAAGLVAGGNVAAGAIEGAKTGAEGGLIEGVLSK